MEPPQFLCDRVLGGVFTLLALLDDEVCCLTDVADQVADCELGEDDVVHATGYIPPGVKREDATLTTLEEVFHATSASSSGSW